MVSKKKTSSRASKLVQSLNEVMGGDLAMDKFFLEMMGRVKGVSGLASLLHEEVLASKPGSSTRFALLKMLVDLVEKYSPSDNVSGKTDEELENEAAELMRKHSPAPSTNEDDEATGPELSPGDAEGPA